MDYEGFFVMRLDALRAEGRYRVFADFERRSVHRIARLTNII